jgi:hypothetical protein
MSENWKQAKRELRKEGISVNTSLKGCCLGCLDNAPFADEQPAIFQLSSRWDSYSGGYLSHQNIGDTMLAVKVMAILNSNGINWDWNGSEVFSIGIKLEDN